MRPWVECPSSSAIDELIHVSRLIGSDPTLVLHSGGNTSIKSSCEDIYGNTRDVLFIKGSGSSLASIDESGFAAVDLELVRRLLTLAELSDFDMVNELRRAMFDTSGPNPSLETLLHAFLPQRVILHTHADTFLAISNTPDQESLLRDIYGDLVVQVGYHRPGLPLARACVEAWEDRASAQTIGLLLERHGVFTFGDTAEQAYARMAQVIGLAESRVAAARSQVGARGRLGLSADPVQLAKFRATVSDTAGKPLVMTRENSTAVGEFVELEGMADLVARGPVTPDHVIRTKPRPMVGRDVGGYSRDYEAYFSRHRQQWNRDDLVMLNPAPRVVLDSEWGLLALGETYAAARTTCDVFLHSIDTIVAAEALGGYRPIATDDLFEVEYWALEQAKLRLADTPHDLTGQVAIVTGAASGIGRACAQALLDKGAAVCGLDISPGIDDTFADAAWLGVQADVTNADQMESAITQVVTRFGGVDIAVIGAGIFGTSTPIAQLDGEEWSRVMSINTESVLMLFQRLHPILEASPVAARVVVIGSKNVPAPGKGAAAYSMSKAALVQLCRVAALEWADAGIRVNMVHPDAVFDTGLWTPELLAERAARYDLTVDDYKRRNLLSTEVTSRGVAALVTDMCGPGFATTTGAQVPVDGGSDRVI